MNDPHDAETPADTPEARFGAELRRVRVQADLSVRQLAKDLQRAHSTISDFETGRRLAPVEAVEQYEDRFGLPRGTLGAQRERARAERLESPRDGTLAENLGDVVCPYMGLRAFERKDAALFHGRKAQRERDLARLAETRFLAVVGPSGSGKSSYARAGLLPSLTTPANDGSSPDLVLLAPGEHPLDALVAAVGDTAQGEDRLHVEDLRVDPGVLRRATGHCDGGVLILVDQFEELFTLCGDEAERRSFVSALMAGWRDPSSRVSLIIALRADFYGHITPYPEA